MPSWRLGLQSKPPNPASTIVRDSLGGTNAQNRDDAQCEPSSHETSHIMSTSPSSSPSQSRSHVRSTSQTFPSIFGSFKKKQEALQEHDFKSESLPNISLFPGGSQSEFRSNKSKLEESDFDLGSCATCDSRVKWPRGISEFRCTTCFMVNDLKPAQKPTLSPFESNSLLPTDLIGSEDCPRLDDEGPHLTIERTVSIINECMDSYFKSRQALKQVVRGDDSTTPPHSPMLYTFSTNTCEPEQDLETRYKDRQLLASLESHASKSVQYNSGNPVSSKSLPAAPCTHFTKTSMAHPTRPPPPPPPPPKNNFATDSFDNYWRPVVRKPVPCPMPLSKQNITIENLNVTSRLPESNVESAKRPLTPPIKHERTTTTQIAKTIFKPLEIMITQAFGNFEYLNTSFIPPRPRCHRAAHSEDDIFNRPPRSASKVKHLSGGLSDLDPKTLLLGNVAENSSWWTGGDERARTSRLKPERSVDKTHRLVTSKSPRIDWDNLRLWYRTVIEAGALWQEAYARFAESQNRENKTYSKTPNDINIMESEITEARSHVQTTLIKACETVVKRPGRQLKHADDIRFLLIILANPLLFPDSATKLANKQLGIANFGRISSTSPKGNSKSASESKRSPSCRDNLSISTWDRSQVFGVIKRTIGLLSNLPHECHRCLTTWFSSFEENHFRQIVSLLESFVTRRLSRQRSHKPSGARIPTDGLIPELSGSNAQTSAQLHAALGLSKRSQRATDLSQRIPLYSDDWQIKSAARLMALLFSANKVFHGKTESLSKKQTLESGSSHGSSLPSSNKRYQLLPTSDFYNTMLDYSDLIVDFDAWESKKAKFSFCQYPFFISMGAKIRIMEHDARRQMSVKAREAFFSSILQNRTLDQYLVLKVRRDCLVEDSMKSISEVVGAGQEEIKKGLKVQFVNEEGIDAGGLRKEWFLLLIREIFDPRHGMFLYDEESQLCYFNPHSFETSDQYFLVGALLGLAIYNSTILDVALPSFAFKKLLMSGPSTGGTQSHFNKGPLHLTVDDLAEYRPALASGLRKLLEFDGDVQETFCRDFVADIDRFGTIVQVPLCSNGESRPVTNSTRQEFVDLYVRYLLDTAVARQFEPFKRGFFTVCGGNALSLFQPEEIELLIRGSDDPLDVPALKAVAAYQNWRKENQEEYENPAEEIPLVKWFWEFFESAAAKDQRKLLSFITGSDRIPAVGATSLIIRVCFAGKDTSRLPVARTCFNQLLLYKYRSREEFVGKLWQAVTWSEGFGLK